MTEIRCGLCAAALAFCTPCLRWFHEADQSFKCRGVDVHGHEKPPAAAVVANGRGLQPGA